MGKKKRVGLFGGSFDPIHFGHLNLALSILEIKKLDQILFCPAHTSPLKSGEPPRASKEDRLKMVEAAIEGIEQFSLLDYELNRPPPSYTIDTVRFLQNSESELHLILGQDSLAHLSKWKEIDQLLRMAPPFIGSRAGELPVLPPAFSPIIEAGLVTIPLMQISSTDIRARLRQGLFCGHLLPAQVLKFINQKKLYNAT